MKGLKLYELSIKLYENGNTKGNWEYIDTNFQLSLAYLMINNKEKAKEYINKILKIEPEFGMAKWVLINRCI